MIIISTFLKIREESDREWNDRECDHHSHSICKKTSKNLFKGLVARSAFKLEFSELHFFLFNSLNCIYMTYILRNFNFLPSSFKNIMT